MRELSLNVMDIVQNSVRAGASLITVQVAESKKHDTLIITITDNGCGMSAEQVKSVIDPFFTTRTTRKVGLGVPLFKMEADTVESDVPCMADIKSFGGNRAEHPRYGIYLLLFGRNTLDDFCAVSTFII